GRLPTVAAVHISFGIRASVQLEEPQSIPVFRFETLDSYPLLFSLRKSLKKTYLSLFSCC
ncbi:hypothetical protein LINPERPRIM_LOCUS14597, partial [Linum perenne]